MTRASATLAALAMLFGAAGCGGDNTNSAPEGAGTVEYAKQSQDKLAAMYGAPKPEKAKSNNAADIMNNYRAK